MKKSLLLVCCCISIHYLQAQKQITPVIYSYSPPTSQCITPRQQAMIKERVQKNVQYLMANGILHKPTFAEANATFKLGWPLKPSSNFTDSNYYGVTNFVDHDNTTGILDWNCGTRTYDGHNGTDISLWPFPWYMMDNKMVKIIAAADGVIVDKHDGEFDRECDAPDVPANYVVLQHSNGYQTVYYHMKKGTVTKKAIGTSVKKGTVLGYVGSSGSSTGPHLHFSVYDADGNLLDPYKGNCNTISSSLWSTQKPYWGKKINKIMVTTTPPVYPYCPNREQINEFDTIPLGWAGNFFVFLSEIKDGDTIYLKILKPNSQVWQDFNYVVTPSFVSAYFYWIFIFDLNEPKGTWKWQVTYNHKTFSYNFYVTDPSDFTMESPDDDVANNFVRQTTADNGPERIAIFPNPAKNNIQVQLNADAGNYQLDILNSAGIVVKQQTITAVSGKTILNFNLKIIPGTYQMHIYNNTNNLHKAFVVE